MTAGALRTARVAGARPFRRQRRQSHVAGYLFVAPTVVFFLVFVAYPFVRAGYLSLTKWSGFGTPRFVGLENFRNLLSDPTFWTSFKITIGFTVACTVVQTIVPLAVAILLGGRWRGSVSFRTVFFLPTVISLVVTAVIWQLIYDPNFGILNELLRTIGLGGLAHGWLGDQTTVLPAILLVSLWQSFGFFMLILYAGLQGIDRTLYDAARVDGASRWQEVRHVTLPGLRPVIGVVLTVNIINGLKTFDIVYVMTGGGPNHGSEVLGTYLYSLAFGSQAGAVPAMGYATAISMVVFGLSMVAVLVQFRLSKGVRHVVA
jgi:ABC-type sugar transport system permease subunit